MYITKALYFSSLFLLLFTLSELNISEILLLVSLSLVHLAFRRARLPRLSLERQELRISQYKCTRVTYLFIGPRSKFRW